MRQLARRVERLRQGATHYSRQLSSEHELIRLFGQMLIRFRVNLRPFDNGDNAIVLHYGGRWKTPASFGGHQVSLLKQRIVSYFIVQRLHGQSCIQAVQAEAQWRRVMQRHV